MTVNYKEDGLFECVILSDEEIEKDRLKILEERQIILQQDKERHPEVYEDVPEEDLVEDDIGLGSSIYYRAIIHSDMLLNMVSEYLLKHPAILHDKDNYREASKAFQHLFNLQQLLGFKHYKD